MNNKLLLSVAFGLLFVLAACTPVVPVVETQENESTTNNTIVDLPVEQPVETPTEEPTEIPEIEEEVDETPVEANEEYAAIVRAVERDLIDLNTRAVDPDGDEVTLTFSEPFTDGVWQTEVGDEGEYEITIVASDGQEETNVTVLVVVDALNMPPSITGPDIIEVEEGQTINLDIFTVEDPEGDDLVVSYSGWMDSSEYTTTYEDAGTHSLSIIAEDTAGNEAEKEVEVRVFNVNRKPRLMVETTEISVVEGDIVQIIATAEDADNDDVVISYAEPFNQNGEWKTTAGDMGEYKTIITADDGEDVVTREVYITITPRNRAPVIIVERNIDVFEGDVIRLGDFLTIQDPDGDNIEVEYSGWMTSATKATTYDDAGEYIVTITATDGELETIENIPVVVNNVNRPPVFTAPA